ncbi:MAG: putative molybdenum carrier protein [Nitrospirales bacterium]
MITKIISGGQTVADRGGLDAAIHCRWPHGGWCPKDRKAEDGMIPSQYHLNEMATPEYLPRTKANVFDSDAGVLSYMASYTPNPHSGVHLPRKSIISSNTARC